MTPDRLTPETCPHMSIAPQLAAVSSVMAVQVTMFGFKCEDCGKQWDMGNAAEALREVAALQQRVEAKLAALAASPTEAT